MVLGRAVMSYHHGFTDLWHTATQLTEWMTDLMFSLRCILSWILSPTISNFSSIHSSPLKFQHPSSSNFPHVLQWWNHKPVAVVRAFSHVDKWAETVSKPQIHLLTSSPTLTYSLKPSTFLFPFVSIFRHRNGLLITYYAYPYYTNVGALVCT